MDILTQYYNTSGQIISRVPNLATREFYRDAMCRHRFNEMFVASPQAQGASYSFAYNSIQINFFDASGTALEMHENGGTVVQAYDGLNGRKAIGTRHESEAISGGGSISFTSKNIPIEFNNRDFSVKIIAKFPEGYSGGIFFNLYDSLADQALRIYIGTQYFQSKLSTDGLSIYCESQYSSGSFWNEGYNWHIFDVRLLSSTRELKNIVDGTTVKTADISPSGFSHFTSPNFYIGEDENYQQDWDNNLYTYNNPALLDSARIDFI